MGEFERRLPVGAEFFEGAGTHFRVWAPSRASIEVEVRAPLLGTGHERVELVRDSKGYFAGLAPSARPGSLYRFRLDGGDQYPDPASRYQPDGPHGPSCVVDPQAFEWRDAHWKGAHLKGQIIYELHVGTFTEEGTLKAALAKLPALRELGITLIELLPMAEFAGARGWGYDGVNLFAVYRKYGTPDDLRRFVDQAHHIGIGVILDVVYNHLGPDGNYLGLYSKCYFSSRYKTDWGEALNFDGEDAEPVREYFVANARYWIREYHLDGLRLDATQNIYDSSSLHILSEIGQAARDAAGERAIVLVAEMEEQRTDLVRPTSIGGYGFDGLWNDDFHHSATVAITGRREAYYTDYQGTPSEVLAAMKWGYLYQGQWYEWQKQRRGTPAWDLAPCVFVTFLENHDQVANQLDGKRLHAKTSPTRLRAMTTLLLLGPGTPMLFQGQEHGDSSRFLFFVDHKDELREPIKDGRALFLSQFASAKRYGNAVQVDPCDRLAFEMSKLRWDCLEANQRLLRLHRDLIALRIKEKIAGRAIRGGFDGAVLGPDALVLRYFGDIPRGADDRLLVVNWGRDLELRSCSEPLLAPPTRRGWDVAFASSDLCYDGSGCASPEAVEGRWLLSSETAFWLTPRMQRA